MMRSALLAAVLAASCHAQGISTTFTGSFSACAKADVGAVVSKVEADVAAIIAGNSAGLEAALVGLAATAGWDAVACGLAAAEAAFAAAEGSGSAISLMTAPWRLGAARAHAAIQAHQLPASGSASR